VAHVKALGFETSTILRHAGTVWIGQIAVMGFGVADTMIAGRHSDEALAALSIGAAVYMSIYVALMGVLQAQLPVWSELRGAGKLHALGASVRQAFYLCLMLLAIGVPAMLMPQNLLHWTQVPPDLQPMVTDYLRVQALGLVPSMLFRMYSTLNQALGKPRLVTWIQLGALAVKIPLSVWFALGGWGLSAGGAVGCAWATVLVNMVMLALGTWLLRTQSLYLPYAIWKKIEPPDWPTLKEFLRLGVPNGLTILIEVTSFTLISLFVARLGVQAAASHQVAANLAAVLYMMPLALGLASSARVSFWRGAGDEARARAVLGTGLGLTASLAVLVAGLCWLLRLEIAQLYTGNPELAAVTAALLAWVAIYHPADAVQAMSIFALRSYRITVAPLLIYTFLLWGVGLGGGYLLCYHGLLGIAPMNTPAAFWIAGALGLILTAVLFVVLLWWAVNQAKQEQQRQSPNEEHPKDPAGAPAQS
jgi:MATE family multidrug resistance protein